MSDSETPLLDDEPTSPLFCDEDTLSGDAEPPSPGGSTKGLYVRSRPTSIDGPMIEFPSGGMGMDLDLSQFGLTPAPAPTAPLIFPMPPVTISAVPHGKRRRYAASVKSLYTGTGTGTSLKTNHAPVVPVQLVRRDLCDVPDTPVNGGKTRRGVLKAIKKIVPGLFHRPTAAVPAAALAPIPFNELPMLSPVAVAPEETPSPSTGFSFSRGRALSIRSFKSAKSKGKGKSSPSAAGGIENRPPLPVRAVTAPVRPRGHSFSGYLSDDEDETDPEIRAINRETNSTVRSINRNYVFQPVDAVQIGVAL
ncbi:hypothetical protein B0H11DRAFT_2429909 [Mycena galericulata]|nr:hypothetical protein B0H11DRAFT_2429909 [Mycena galericulata]